MTIIKLFNLCKSINSACHWSSAPLKTTLGSEKLRRIGTNYTKYSFLDYTVWPAAFFTLWTPLDLPRIVAVYPEVSDFSFLAFPRVEVLKLILKPAPTKFCCVVHHCSNQDVMLLREVLVYRKGKQTHQSYSKPNRLIFLNPTKSCPKNNRFFFHGFVTSRSLSFSGNFFLFTRNLLLSIPCKQCNAPRFDRTASPFHQVWGRCGREFHSCPCSSLNRPSRTVVLPGIVFHHVCQNAQVSQHHILYACHYRISITFVRLSIVLYFLLSLHNRFEKLVSKQGIAGRTADSSGAKKPTFLNNSPLA